MATYEIEPYVGVGPLQLGMTRDEVRATVGLPLRPTGHRGSDPPGDFFPAVGLFADYRAPGVCEYLEFADVGGVMAPTFQGRAFLGQPYGPAREWFAARDAELITEEAGLRSPLYGITLYAPRAEAAPDDPIESVGVFERGLYERRLQELAERYSIARRRRSR